VWNADEYAYGGSRGYYRRIRQRSPPHNVYTDTATLRQLGEDLGATPRVEEPAWQFTDELPLAERPQSGRLVVPYPHNRVSYRYDRVTNRYLRGTSTETRQIDAGTGDQVAPANVVVLFMRTGRLQDTGADRNNVERGRLELGYIGTGRALVLRNGEVIDAVWSKADDAAPTFLHYASGPREGEPVELVRGQIFIQVVPNRTDVEASGPGVSPGPSSSPIPGGSSAPSASATSDSDG
jgi:hypothetical protein